MFITLSQRALQIAHRSAANASFMQADFDFSGLAIVLAGISFGLAGVILAGSMLFPETAEKYKRMIPNVLLGLVLVGISSAIVGAMGG